MSDINKRRDDRTSVDWIGMIRLVDGDEIPCTIKDVSRSGMKLTAPQDRSLPETFTLKVVGRNLVFRVRLAWRREHQVGVQIERIARLPKDSAAAPAPQAAETAHNRLGSRERYQPGL
ncbi:PilZ domain-containing protein [Methylobacterium sp. NEAU 140]|uniref:PilZ domain-containing protein n=1 Tax=Methylobacterium sp. NEAU 140 TaxID=3064945 RepID=UPI002732C9A7|nr:PilZ domain-containing protein [Methylobacterium sp. NEAU 140]MDP4022557.1 PilZ domain-containing protein [Methylobacterium sp. NEAU 140]